LTSRKNQSSYKTTSNALVMIKQLPIIIDINRMLDARQVLSDYCQVLSDYCQSDDLCVDGLRKRIDQYVQIEDIVDLSTSTGRLLLHHACMNEKVTVDIVRLLIDTFPNAAGGTDEEDFQVVPLHVACWNENTTLEIVKLLIDAFPESVCRQSVDGGMPLHYLCCGDCADALNILELLLEKYPVAVEHPTQTDMLPIHLACLASKSSEFCQVLIEAYPGSDDDDESSGDADVIDRQSTEYLNSIFQLVRTHHEAFC
jgi:ankyrin repeat protein